MEMTARTLQGLALVSLGRVEEGSRLLDEGTTAATAGELHDPIAIGSCCCNMIIACERSRDYDRAGQWCEHLEAFCERTGPAAAARALPRPPRDRSDKCGENRRRPRPSSIGLAASSSTLRPALAGYAQARFADLRRRQGRYSDAHELLSMAESHVLVPLVKAALALDEDDPAAASHAARFLDRYDGGRPVETARGLELLVYARAVLGYPDSAREAHEELRSIATAVGTKAARAGERACAAAIAAAEADWEEARLALEDAVALYRSSPAPFERCAGAELDLAARVRGARAARIGRWSRRSPRATCSTSWVPSARPSEPASSSRPSVAEPQPLKRAGLTRA